MAIPKARRKILGFSSLLGSGGEDDPQWNILSYPIVSYLVLLRPGWTWTERSSAPDAGWAPPTATAVDAAVSFPGFDC